MSYAARRFLAAELWSKGQTNMLVSRKNLTFIHLVPSETAAGVDMAKPAHEGVHFLRVPRIAR